MNTCSKDPSEYCLDCKNCLIMKYVRFGVTDYIFLPLHVPHNYVSLKDNKQLSAGFYNFDKNKTFGHSESLKLKPKKEDSEIIRILFKV